MEKDNNMKKKILKLFALALVCIFSCFTFSGCFTFANTGSNSGSSSGGNSGNSGSGNQGGNTGGDDEGFDLDKYLEENIISDYNKLFLGGIGVYDVDNEAEVFYDNYTHAYVNFNQLIDRQFETLAKVIYDNLKYVWGDGTFTGEISGYSAIGSVLTYDNLVTTTLYNNDKLQYKNAMTGDYQISQVSQTPATDESGNPLYDESGNQVYNYTYEYKAITDSTAYNPWLRKDITIDDLIKELRFIYVNQINSNETTDDLNWNNLTLRNSYKSFNGKLETNDDIDFIGFDRNYMWNVMYYIAYSIIGESFVSNSNSARNIIFAGGNVMQKITPTNYNYFNSFKNYDEILPEIVENSFKLTIGSTDVVVSNNYCFSKSNDRIIDWDKTLFPTLKRAEYIFYDDVNDICDAEATVQEEIDYDNYDENENKEPTILKVGSLRKLKEIIFIPKITNWKKSSFTWPDLFMCFSTKDKGDDVALNILVNAVGNNASKKIENKQYEFDDGSYYIEIEGSDPIIGEATNEDITDKGYLKLSNIPSSDSHGVLGTFYDTSNKSEDFEYGSISASEENLVINSFVNDSYNVESTNENIDIGRINVWNNLICYDSNNQANIKFTNNYIQFIFEYYSSNGTKLSEIPETYLIAFDFM